MRNTLFGVLQFEKSSTPRSNMLFDPKSGVDGVELRGGRAKKSALLIVTHTITSNPRIMILPHIDGLPLFSFS
jgi:hypothetical protein